MQSSQLPGKTPFQNDIVCRVGCEAPLACLQRCLKKMLFCQSFILLPVQQLWLLDDSIVDYEGMSDMLLDTCVGWAEQPAAADITGTADIWSWHCQRTYQTSDWPLHLWQCCDRCHQFTAERCLSFTVQLRRRTLLEGIIVVIIVISWSYSDFYNRIELDW